MSTVKSNNHQVGQSGTATNNFTLYQPTTPDGTVRLGVGNTGATTLDVLTATNAGNVTVNGTLTATSLSGTYTGTVAVANGGTGQTTANAAFNALAPSQATNAGRYLTTNGTNTSWAIAQGIVSGTVVNSTSGTSIDFTGIPSWAKRITVMFNGVSLSGSASLLVQIGSGSPTTSGYSSVASNLQNASAVAVTTSTAGFIVFVNFNTENVIGTMDIVNVTGNTWVASGVANSSSGITVALAHSGNVALAGVLDRVRITTTNGTDTFDAGSVNILYQG